MCFFHSVYLHVLVISAYKDIARTVSQHSWTCDFLCMTHVTSSRVQLYEALCLWDIRALCTLMGSSANKTQSILEAYKLSIDLTKENTKGKLALADLCSPWFWCLSQVDSAYNLPLASSWLVLYCSTTWVAFPSNLCHLESSWVSLSRPVFIITVLCWANFHYRQEKCTCSPCEWFSDAYGKCGGVHLVLVPGPYKRCDLRTLFNHCKPQLKSGNNTIHLQNYFDK